MPESIQDLQREINTYYFKYAIDSITGLKDECRATLKKLGSWLDMKKASDYSDVTMVLKLCNMLIDLYDVLKDTQLTKTKLLSYDETILWITSKEGDMLCPPYDDNVGIFLDNRHESDSVVKLSGEGLKDLYQESASNCSFVAALLSIADCSPSLFDDILVYDPSTKEFAVKFHFNLTLRTMIMDKKLPDDRGLLVKSSSNDHLIWPCFIEKAYMKIYGYNVEESYLFHGSNFANDCFLLTGWIPEYVPITDITKELMYDLYGHYKNRTVLLGLGTGDEANQSPGCELKTIPNHDYALVDIEECEDSELGISFGVLNPWSSIEDRIVNLTNPAPMFETLYINWNPSIFKFNTRKVVVSLSKSKSKLQGPELFLGNYQQYSIVNESNTEQLVWVLLEKSLNNDFAIDTQWFLTESFNQKVYDKSLLKLHSESYDNESKFQLCKFKIPPARSVTGVFRESMDAKSDSGSSPKISTFSIKCFSNTRVKVEKAVPLVMYETRVDGHWEANLGGNFTTAGFIYNPQFEIFIEDSVDREVEVKVGLLSSRSVQCNLLIFAHHSQSVPFKTSFESTNLVFNQKTEYSHGGIFYNDLTLSTNQKYVAIPSTYNITEVNESDNFQIYVNSPVKSTKVAPINCTLGLFTKTVKFHWDDKNVENITFSVKHRTNILAHIHSSDSLAVSIKSTLSSVADGVGQKKICTTGAFDSSIFGLFLGGTDVEIPEGTYNLSVERSDRGVGECTVEIGTSTRIDI